MDKLPDEAQVLLNGKGGSREREWNNMVNATTKEGGPVAIVHRGACARELRAKFAHRLIPSRWLEKWTDMVDEYQFAITDDLMQSAGIPDHHDAKSRWILQGFHDPDIEILNRSVPTPEAADIPLSLQMIASLESKGLSW